MRKSLFGFFFGVVLMLLMLAAMVSAPAEEEAAAQPPKPLPACRMLPQQPAAPERAEGKGEPAPERREAVGLLARFPAPSCPAADANGVPLLRMTYRRANFRAFHYPDEAG